MEVLCNVENCTHMAEGKCTRESINVGHYLGDNTADCLIYNQTTSQKDIMVIHDKAREWLHDNIV